MTLRSVAIVGPGRMGLTLAQGLWDSGVVGSITVYGRHPDPPGHPLFAQGSAEYVYGAAPLDGRTAALILAVLFALPEEGVETPQRVAEEPVPAPTIEPEVPALSLNQRLANQALDHLQGIGHHVLRIGNREAPSEGGHPGQHLLLDVTQQVPGPGDSGVERIMSLSTFAAEHHKRRGQTRLEGCGPVER